MTDDKRKTKARSAPCAVCGKPQDPQHRPFCSARCRDIDLGRWLGERYAIPTSERPDAGGTGPGNED